MRLILILLPACLFAQASSLAVDLRRDSLAECAAAPIAAVLEGADEWLQTYERNGPDPHARPPYLTLARFYALKAIRTEEIPTLLEKGVRELSAPGSYTQARTHGNSPFEDDIERALAANVYTQIRLYDKAGELLARTGETVDHTNAAELDMGKARIFEKGVRELSAPGSYTQARTHGNSPFEDDIERALAANVYTQIRLYDKAGELLARTGETVDHTT